MVNCEACNATGVITLSSTCPRCEGTAEVIIYEDDGTEKTLICPNCEDGLLYTEQTCPACKGRGQVY